MTTMKKSMNRAELLEFPSFLSISHVENMSACLRENLGFFKFFTETEFKTEKSFARKYYSKSTESTI